MRILLLVSVLALVISCKKDPQVKAEVDETVRIDTLQATSLLGNPLIRRQVDEQRDSLQVANYKAALSAYQKDTTNIDSLIWLGRRIAYLGDYQNCEPRCRDSFYHKRS